MPMQLRCAGLVSEPTMGPRCMGSLAPQLISGVSAPLARGWDVRTMCFFFEDFGALELSVVIRYFFSIQDWLEFT